MPTPSATTDAARAPDGPSDAAGATPAEALWAERARALIDWFRPWEVPCRGSLGGADPEWFPGARLNASWNCLDRHLERHGERTALIWEGDAEHEARRWSFRELHERTCRFANALKGIGVRRGDRVCLYLPVIPEAVVAMLACARIGAVHAVVYAGFSPDALRGRLRDAGCSVVVTADCTMRGGRRVPLKANADLACEGVEGVRRIVVVRRDGSAEAAAGPDAVPDVPWNPGRDLWYHELVQGASADCAAVEMEATDPLFVLYTSGSSGRPKGVVHATGGYLVHVAASCRDVFGHAGGDVHWCAADLGWITAHSYAVYGPLANATTTLLHEGVSTWPDAGRWWRMVERHAVSVLYTSPTALRAIRALGDGGLEGTDRSSLRLLGTVGEPVDRDTWRWYAERVGEGRCRVIDTWWQTETGGIVMVSDPDADAPAPADTASPEERPRGGAVRPLDGLSPELVDASGETVEGAGGGELVLAASWPGQATTLWNDRDRYAATYLARHPGRWATGDGARRDAEGRWWLTGRLDDLLELSGRRVGAAEIEALLMGHPDVAEAAVVGRDVPGLGQRVAAWVRPMREAPGDEAAAALRGALEDRVREGLGELAVPERIRFSSRLPKSRSGKLMRRMLKKIAERDFDDLGDITTLADPSIVDALVADELAGDAAG